MTPNRPVMLLLALLLALLPAIHAPINPAMAQAAPMPPPPPPPPPSEDCLEQIEHGRRPEIHCEVPLRLTPAEQAELEKSSRGYVRNVACTLTIRIARAEIDKVVEAADVVFQSPGQPVHCTVTTHRSTFDVTAAFAPRVVVAGGVATAASPGLGGVVGVSRALSWPVVQFVNRWPSVESGMLQVVNAYRAHAARRRSEDGRR